MATHLSSPLSSLQLNSVVSDGKVSRRERKNSNSSSVSSVSSYSSPVLPRPPKRRPPPRTPKRASSAPLMGVATPPADHSTQSPVNFVSGPSSTPPPSSAPSLQCHAPLQVYPLLPLLPFMAPPMSHPHFVYNPSMMPSGQDHLENQPYPLLAQPHPFSYNWNCHMMDTNSSLQPMWANQAPGHVITSTGHVIGSMEHVTGSPGYVVTTQDHVIGSPRHSPDHVTAKEHVIKATAGMDTGQCDESHVECNLGTDSGAGLSSTGALLATPPGMKGCGPAQGFYSLLNNKELTSDPASYQTIPSCSIWTPPSCDQDRVQWPSQGKDFTQ